MIRMDREREGRERERGKRQCFPALNKIEDNTTKGKGEKWSKWSKKKKILTAV